MASIENRVDEMATQLRTMAEQLKEEDIRVYKKLYARFLAEPTTIDWGKSHPIDPKYEVAYESLPSLPGNAYQPVLQRLVVVKLNGGLGTTMGCSGPKSLIELRGGLTFLDFALMQHRSLNDKFRSAIPLYLMNSFNTERETASALALKDQSLTKKTFQFSQNKCPRIYADSLLPVAASEEERWYPPGHGNVFEAMVSSGVLDDCLAAGRDIAFFSNIDNTGACVDLQIAGAMAAGMADYIMEVTRKTESDIKGGTLIELDGRLMHLEAPQVPPEKLAEFCSLETFKMFNTNNIWVNLRAVKEKLDNEGMEMEIIANKKTLSNERKIIQLETSIGGAIRNFPGRALSVRVERHRFLPVKSTQDLLALMSNAYEVDEESYVLKPLISLSREFASIAEFRKRFSSIPDTTQLKTLKVEGDVSFGKGVKLVGHVSVVAKSGQTIKIEDDSLLIGQE